MWAQYSTSCHLQPSLGVDQRSVKKASGLLTQVHTDLRSKDIFIQIILLCIILIAVFCLFVSVCVCLQFPTYASIVSDVRNTTPEECLKDIRKASE